MLKKNFDLEQDFLTAQMLDRENQQNNAQQHNYDEDYAMDCDYQSDSEYATQLEHEWLKQKYGMTDTKASDKVF